MTQAEVDRLNRIRFAPSLGVDPRATAAVADALRQIAAAVSVPAPEQR